MTLKEYKAKFVELAEQMEEEHGRFSSVEIENIAIRSDYGNNVFEKKIVKVVFNGE